MYITGITGNMGSGKSTVAHIFFVFGIPIYNADKEAKRIINSTEVQTKLIHYFGKSICADPLSENQTLSIDKKKLASEIFNSPEKLKFINQLVHPLVKTDFESWCTKQHAPYLLMESALIFECGWENLFDKLILVRTPKSLQIQRIMMRDKSTLEEVNARLKNQIPSSEKANNVDYIIENNEELSLLEQTLFIDKELREPLKSNKK